MANKWSERLLRTRAQVQTLIGASGLNYPGFYQISNAVGATKQILVWSLSDSTITDFAQDMTSGEMGVYDITADTFTASGIAYKSYVAFLTQSGTSAPVATVIQNELSGAIAWTRTGVGTYKGTLASAFVANKTVLPNDAMLSADGFPSGVIGLENPNVNEIEINTYDASGSLADDMLSIGGGSTAASRPYLMEIRIYP